MNRRQTILLYIVFAALCASCLFCTQAKIHDALIQGKWFAFYFSSLFLGFLFGCPHRGYCYTIRVVDLIVCIIAIYLSIHNLMTDNLVEFWTNLLSILTLYYVIRLQGYNLSFNTIAWMMLSCSAVLSLWGISQIDSFEALRCNTTFTGPFESCAAYALSLALCLPFILYLFRYEKRNRTLLIVVLALTSIMIVLSQSRTAWLTAFASVLFLYACTNALPKSITSAVKCLFPCVFVFLVFLLYYIRPESANGRLLIWFNTLSLWMQHPLFGNGYSTFTRDHMLQQSDYFRTHPDSHFSMIADCISHPFNEYLHLLIQWGIVGLLLFVLLAYILIVVWRKIRNAEYDTIASCLIVIAVFSFFSYPFCYPFTWVVLVYCVAELARRSKEIFTPRFSSLSYFFPICFGLGIGMNGVLYYRHQRWYDASRLYEKKPQTAILQYQDLYPRLQNDPYFLYNYAAIHYEEAHYNECLQLLDECSKRLNDYDVQMLKGMALRNLNLYDESLNCFQCASYMCPSKFMPLYQAFETMVLCERKDKAIELCKEIMEKPIKVDSEQVKYIKVKCSVYYNTFFINN